MLMMPRRRRRRRRRPPSKYSCGDLDLSFPSISSCLCCLCHLCRSQVQLSRIGAGDCARRKARPRKAFTFLILLILYTTFLGAQDSLTVIFNFVLFLIRLFPL